MADLMSLYADLHGVRAQDPMLQGISQASVLGEKEQALMALQRALEYQSSNRGGGAAGGMGRAADKLRAHQQQNKYLETLQGALNNQQGLDQYQQKIQAIQEQIQAEEAMRAKQQAAQAGGWSPGQAQAVAMGLKLPEQPEPESTPNLIKSLQAAGIDPRSPEGRKIIEQNLGGKNTTYNVTPPTGYTFADPTNPSAGFAVIPGSPQEREMRESQARQQETASGQRFSAENVVNTIDRLKGSVGPTTAGWGGLAAEIPGSSAKTVKNDLNTVMANLAFDRLQSMRDASKTGGALGQVSERELELLKSSVAGLEQTQDPEELKKRLDIVRNSYQRFIDALNGKMPEGYDEQGNPVQETQGDDSQIYHNPETGEKIRWNGKTWVVVQ